MNCHNVAHVTHQVLQYGGEEALELCWVEGLVRVDVDLAEEGGVVGVLERGREGAPRAERARTLLRLLVAVLQDEQRVLRQLRLRQGQQRRHGGNL